ncbi:hypothetical protein CROQUDRAFT_664323 [Cronartium quercuum f. sp. fusiforme G11]|uniref:Uncharacterized protein n=1 Tax=Cronartium quercuum f. sp. fusiforme G11 TaxID=708437 RepID=A0A9P6N772_9BASI|nr:hypothetical protein CROQUDRAFT_664323 [Cronartium quercuum f. sp. fusiforme G11]
MEERLAPWRGTLTHRFGRTVTKYCRECGVPDSLAHLTLLSKISIPTKDFPTESENRGAANECS